MSFHTVVGGVWFVEGSQTAELAWLRPEQLFGTLWCSFRRP